MLGYIVDALKTLCSVTGILYIVGGALLGVFFGALPGLSGGMVMTLLLPVTFKMDGVLALALFMALHVGSSCGGAIGSILLGIPGTSSSIATTWDGYEFTKRGDPVTPLSVTVTSNLLGIIPGIIIAMFLAKTLADFGVKIGPWDYASMIFCALAMVIGLSGASLVKGFAGVGLAIIVSCVGTDPILSRERFTFGVNGLYSGFNSVNIMLGLFAARIILMEYVRQTKTKDASKIKVSHYRWPGKEIRQNFPNIIISFLIGAFIGFLPGLGGPTSSVVAYTTNRSLAKDKDKWGTGVIGGVWSPEVATKGGIGGAMIPMIALGIPGDVIMVQFMTVMNNHNVNPGPRLMIEKPDMVYMLYTAALVASIFVFIIQALAMPLFPKFISLPYHYLYPAIIVISFLGAYMVKSDYFGILVAVGSCILGLIMDNFDIPQMPFIMTFILAQLFEQNLRYTFIGSTAGLKIFVTSPVSLIFLIVGIGVLVVQTVLPAVKRSKAKKADA
ncbi:MAG: tripartite tricarboxylate transporter permease [Firmicutes bacterium]|nr:tripartite tricarboxylate transporter permease [Bacillota bacterium]